MGKRAELSFELVAAFVVCLCAFFFWLLWLLAWAFGGSVAFDFGAFFNAFGWLVWLLASFGWFGFQRPAFGSRGFRWMSVLIRSLFALQFAACCCLWHDVCSLGEVLFNPTPSNPADLAQPKPKQNGEDDPSPLKKWHRRRSGLQCWKLPVQHPKTPIGSYLAKPTRLKK